MKNNNQIAMKAARVSIFVNAAMIVFKFIAGFTAGSAAMISDAIHSLTDLLGTCVAIIGVKLGSRAPDSDHPYGHERFESVATLVLAGIFFITGVLMGWSGISTVFAGNFEQLAAPGAIALIVALMSIGTKEALFWYVRAAALKIDSSVLLADAWHSRIDAISSIGAFVGILAARLGVPIMDAVAAIFISLMILHTAYKTAAGALATMTDRSADADTIAAMKALVLEQEHVIGIDDLRTRVFGNRIYVDVEITVDSTSTLAQAHDISHVVHDAIESAFPKVKHCMVHVSPDEIT